MISLQRNEKHAATATVPPGSEGVRVTLARISWPPGPVMTVTLNGTDPQSRTHTVATELNGDSLVGKGGQPMPDCSVTWWWPGETDGSGGRLVVGIVSLQVILEAMADNVVTELSVEFI